MTIYSSNDRSLITYMLPPHQYILMIMAEYECLHAFSKRLLRVNNEEIHLTPIEYKIVAYLAQNSGKVITYSAILSNVWGPYADGDNKILRVNMANIRRKSEDDPAQPKYIFTEVGVGYRMAEDEEE